MKSPIIYTKDIEIAQALIRRNEQVTRTFFYQKCFPLFKSIFDNYYTDCASYKEFIDEIYLLLLAPSRETGHSQMENYRGESSLKTWIKTACLYYCYAKYEQKERMPIQEKVAWSVNEDLSDTTDRLMEQYGSVNMELDDIDRTDVMTILSLMPNKRYRELIRLRYLEQKTNEETAAELCMSMDNYYNKHKLAKEQFVSMLRKEAKNG